VPRKLGIGDTILGRYSEDGSTNLVAEIVEHHPEVTDGWNVRPIAWGEYFEPSVNPDGMLTVKEWPNEPTSSWQTTLRLFNSTPSKEDRKEQKGYIRWLFSKDVRW
jgi:hypothetical protein